MTERRGQGDPGRLGYPAIDYGRGYGRDFGGGLGQGFDGSWGQGYGGSLAYSDYREGFGGAAYGGGTMASDDPASFGLRGDRFGSGGRSWIDRRAGENQSLAGPHAGKGPKGWKRTDARLCEQLSERLMEDRLLDARGIEVSVADGVVTLAGEAASPAERVLAERLARDSGGVREVVNELRVRPSTAPDREPPLGAQTGAMGSPLKEGERDAEGREEGPRHFPTLSM